MAKKLLAYNITDDRNTLLRAIGASQNVEVVRVPHNLYSASLGYVADISGIERHAKYTDKCAIESEMLVFSGLTPDEVDAFLAFMKKEKLSIPLKAIMTMYNVNWSGNKLYGELRREYGKL